MANYDTMDNGQFVFGAILYVANRMDTLLERALSKYGVTSKQWFLSVLLFSLFDEPPTIKEMARQMGSSHQNVKQVALKLQEKGLVKLEKDPKDARVTRLRLTEKSGPFWAQVTQEGREFMEALYGGVDTETLSVMRQAVSKLMDNLDDMDTSY